MFRALLIRRPASFNLFPYTTLFRSATRVYRTPSPIGQCRRREYGVSLCTMAATLRSSRRRYAEYRRKLKERRSRQRGEISRSEEHTSELQSRFDLVCRLLLEKKKCK